MNNNNRLLLQIKMNIYMCVCVYIGYIKIVLKVLGSASYCSVLGVGEGHSWSGKSCSSVCLYGILLICIVCLVTKDQIEGV